MDRGDEAKEDGGPEVAAGGADPLLGRVLAERYELLELLSTGGMGRIYRGIQRRLDREVAVKCIHPHLLTSEEVVARFMSEARVVSRLSHPNIVRIYDFGREEETAHLFLVMELVSGPDLATVLEEEPVLPVLRAVGIIQQLLGALGEAHAEGVTHRDIKPDNIILQPARGGGERAKLIDFGIATVGKQDKLTMAGQLVGTPHYMAPEQVTGGSVDGRTDLYAVGVLLFQLLTGRLPFDGDTVTEVLYAQYSAPRPDPREVAPELEISSALAEICLRAIAVRPADRFPDAGEFSSVLEEAEPDAAARWSRPTPMPGFGSQRPQRTRPPSVREAAQTQVAIAADTAPPSVEPDRLAAMLVEQARSCQAAGEEEKAIALLWEGVQKARQLMMTGEVDAAVSIWSTLGHRLGAALLSEGRVGEAYGVLKETLDQIGPKDPRRAHVLEQLVYASRARGKPEEAERWCEEAVSLAVVSGARSVAERLKSSGDGKKRASVSLRYRHVEESDSPRRSRTRLRPSGEPPPGGRSENGC